MKIGIYAPFYPPFEGGAERVAQQVARGLSGRFKVCVFTLKTDPQLPDFERDQSAEIHRLPYSQKRTYALTRTSSPALLGLLKNEPIDVLQIHGVSFTDLALRVSWLMRRRRVPTLLVTHGIFEAYEGNQGVKSLPNTTKKYAVRSLLASLIWCSSHVAVTSPAESNLLSKFFFPTARSSVVFNGFNPPAKTASGARFRQRFGLQSAQIVLHVANLKPNKGHLTMLDALPSVTKQFPGVKYLVIGKINELWNDYARDLLDRAKFSPVKDSVMFLGHIPDETLADAYSAADIAIVPSYAETFPLTVLDAMAWGKAIIATDVGGISHMLTNNHNGIVIKAGCEKSLAGALFLLLNDKTKRIVFGQRAKEYAYNHFTWTNAIDNYEKICRNLVW